MAPEIPEYTRRIFLKKSVQAVALTMATQTLPTIATAGLPDGKLFKAADMTALQAVADTIVPSGGAYKIGAKETMLALRIDFMMSLSEPAVAEGVLGGVRFIEAKSAELIGKTGAFTALSTADRAEGFMAMAKVGGVPRQIFAGLRQLGIFAYYTNDACWPFIGYGGTLVGRKAS